MSLFFLADLPQKPIFMITKYLFFALFVIFISVMLALDLGVFHKKDHVIGNKEALLWTLIWIGLSLCVAVLFHFHAEWVHGIHSMDDLLAYVANTDLAAKINPGMDYGEALKIYRNEVTEQFLAGYFLEKSLSLDNIFVMILIFVGFGIDKKYYHRVLFWGIMGAIVMRFIFIFVLGAMVQRFSWILAIFGAILIYSGIKMFLPKGEEHVDTANHPIVKFASKHFGVSPQLDGHNFFTKVNGKTLMTPLFLVLLVIEFSDIIFAVDSIPAVFSVTTDAYIVFFSNILAVMGLRSLFFLLSNIADKFWLLKYGLGCLLTFIGVKMIGHEFFHLDISTLASLFVILGILTFSIVFSLIFHPKEKINQQ